MYNLKKLFKKFDGIFFLLFQIFLFLVAFHSESRIITTIFITYFYYSIFTGWHECVHREQVFNNQLTFNNILGSISISPLLFLSYPKKLKSHLLHHGFTNNPLKDPDYNTNNLLIFSKKKKLNFYYSSKMTTLNFIGIFFKILFLFVILFWFISGKSLVDFLIGYLVGNLIVHYIVNIYPHFKTQSKFGRDLGGIKLFTLLLFSNNFHGTHHKQPNLAWWSILFTS